MLALKWYLFPTKSLLVSLTKCPTERLLPTQGANRTIRALILEGSTALRLKGGRGVLSVHFGHMHVYRIHYNMYLYHLLKYLHDFCIINFKVDNSSNLLYDGFAENLLTWQSLIPKRDWGSVCIFLINIAMKLTY